MRFKVAPLVVLLDSHVRVDVMVSFLCVVHEAPAVVMVHADTRSWINDGLRRVTVRT